MKHQDDKVLRSYTHLRYSAMIYNLYSGEGQRFDRIELKIINIWLLRIDSVCDKYTILHSSIVRRIPLWNNYW